MFEYRVIVGAGHDLQDRLNVAAKDGFRVINVTKTGVLTDVQVVMERKVKNPFRVEEG